MPIEEKILYQFGQYVTDTYTETNITGKSMTWAYRDAKNTYGSWFDLSEKGYTKMFLQFRGEIKEFKQ